MNKYEHKDKVRKIIWQTQKETGKRKNKTMIREANKMATEMTMVHDKPKENWKEPNQPKSIKEILNGTLPAR